jgi:hypothetical protein
LLDKFNSNRLMEFCNCQLYLLSVQVKNQGRIFEIRYKKWGRKNHAWCLKVLSDSKDRDSLEYFQFRDQNKFQFKADFFNYKNANHVRIWLLVRKDVRMFNWKINKQNSKIVWRIFKHAFFLLNHKTAKCFEFSSVFN